MDTLAKQKFIVLLMVAVDSRVRLESLSPFKLPVNCIVVPELRGSEAARAGSRAENCETSTRYFHTVNKDGQRRDRGYPNTFHYITIHKVMLGMKFQFLRNFDVATIKEDK